VKPTLRRQAVAGLALAIIVSTASAANAETRGFYEAVQVPVTKTPSVVNG
jgi:hypothetical protein